MTTLMKRRKRQGLSPFGNNLMMPWRGRFFNSNMDDLNNLIKIDDIFKDDFFEEDSLMPAMNLKEHKKDFEIEFAVPGFDKKDFEVTIEKDVLHVSGEKKLEEEQKEDDYCRQEFSYKSFKRSLMLPPSVDLDQDVKASYKNGILKIRLLKTEEATKQEAPKKVIQVS